MEVIFISCFSWLKATSLWLQAFLDYRIKACGLELVACGLSKHIFQNL